MDKKFTSFGFFSPQSDFLQVLSNYSISVFPFFLPIVIHHEQELLKFLMHASEEFCLMYNSGTLIRPSTADVTYTSSSYVAVLFNLTNHHHLEAEHEKQCSKKYNISLSSLEK